MSGAIERQQAHTLGASPRDEARSVSGASLAPGMTIDDRYVVESALGGGGSGSVYRARHIGLDLPVAIKILARSTSSAPDVQQVGPRFEREARTLARIRHRHVLAVQDLGVLEDGALYLVSELIEGEDLEQRIARGPLSISSVVDLGRQLFAGLTAIADVGVLHRDVKPANIMLHRESDGQIHLKLIDFGIAHSADTEKLTVTGVILGTPHYMAPEQLRGDELDVRSDIYSACAVLYEAVAGRPPFDADSTPLVIGKILGANLPPLASVRPSCPVELAELIERGLSRQRTKRPSHPLEVVAELDRIVTRLGLPTGALAWCGDAAFSGTQPIALDHVDRAVPETEANGVVAAETGDAVIARPSKRRRVALGVGAAAVVLSLGALWLGASSSSARGIETPVGVAAANASAATPAPVDVTVLLDRGLEALSRGEVEVALASYRAACDAAPERADAYRGRGLAAARAGLDDEAIASLERYLALAPEAADAERVRVRLRALREERTRGARAQRAL